MKIFLDTASLEEIREFADLIDGVTTNPSLVAREGRPFRELVAEICRLVSGPVSAEVTALDTEGMVAQARDLAKIADNVVIKIPMGRAGVRAVKKLSAEGIPTNVTLVFSPVQAYPLSWAGSTTGQAMGWSSCKTFFKSTTTTTFRPR